MPDTLIISDNIYRIFYVFILSCAFYLVYFIFVSREVYLENFNCAFLYRIQIFCKNDVKSKVYVFYTDYEHQSMDMLLNACVCSYATYSRKGIEIENEKFFYRREDIVKVVMEREPLRNELGFAAWFGHAFNKMMRKIHRDQFGVE